MGTNRILGVGNDDVPECLLPHVGFGKNLYADFLVCPLAPEREGWMRIVCIDSASHMVVEVRTGAVAGDELRVQNVAGVCADS